MKRNGIQAKKWRKYLKYLAFKLQNYQITCQLFVLREEKSREISRPNLKEFRNGETLVLVFRDFKKGTILKKQNQWCKAAFLLNVCERIWQESRQ
jgi:hypothetical protein